jgi:hypothetical protein
MAWAPARPDPAAITESLDTTETAGPTARAGHIGQISPVFAMAAAVDASRRGIEGFEGENMARALGPLGQQMLAGQREVAQRQAALAASHEAQEELARQGMRIDPETGQVVRLGPPQTGSGAGLGTMLDVEEQM